MLVKPTVNSESSRRRSPKDRPLVLIHPPAVSKRYLKTKFMPYGMAVLYAFLKEHGVPVMQYDFLMEYLFSAPDDIDFHDSARSFSEADFFSFLRGNGTHSGLEAFAGKYGKRLIPDAEIYAFSIVAYHQFWAALLLARYVRKVNPDAVIVFGGPFITIKPADYFAAYGMADFWIKGSGELPLLMLYRKVRGEAGPALDKIPGLIFVDGDRLFEARQSAFPADEELPPDFEGLSRESFRYDHPLSGEQTFFLPYRFSKGCPSRCSFCTGRLVDRFDHKSVEKIITELPALAEKYGTRTFQFADASINAVPSRFSELCDRLRNDFSEIRWYAYARIHGFTPELLRKAKKAGCFSLFWGVESAHQPTVQLLGKRFHVEGMYELIDRAADLGIKNYIHLMYNSPHETQADVEAFIKLVERYIRSDMVVFLTQRFLLEPHSLMFEQPARYALSDIRRVEASVFEREQYTYSEVGGLDQNDVRERNEHHVSMLADHLEWIRYRNMVAGCKSAIIRRFPSGLLVYTGKYSPRSLLVNKLHNRLLAWIRSENSGLREQL